MSKLKLVLKPLTPIVNEITETICAGDKYTWNLGYETREVERENDYFDTLRSVQGCDSVISILHLTVQRPVDDDYSGVIHCGETYEWDYGYGKENITVPGIHTRQKMDDETGCVSIVSTLHLMFSADDVEFSEKEDVPQQRRITGIPPDSTNFFTILTGKSALCNPFFWTKRAKRALIIK